MKVVYKPIDELVIFDLAEFTVKEMAKMASQGYQLGELGKELYWANGIVLDYAPITSTDTVHKELIEHRRAHWRRLIWGRMPEYKPIIDFKEGVKIPVLDVSSDPVFDGVTKWIKEKEGEE